MAGKAGFKTVEHGMNLEEIDEQVRKHRMATLRKCAYLVIGIAVVAAVVYVWMEMRSYDSYEIRNKIEQAGSIAARYESFNGQMIEYSNDGIICRSKDNGLIWNQSFEMSSPTIAKCKEYLVIYDKGGSEIFIMTIDGLKKRIETARPIQKTCLASQGTIAVLMKENETSYVKLYDRQGKELANGQFFGDEGGYPIDLALSYDAKKLAIDMIDVNEGKIKSTITFYNFGSVGQNEINNNVGSYSFPDLFIPEIKYVSNERMFAVGDSRFIIFDGAEKPEVTKEIEIDQTVTSVFYDEKYIGTTYQNASEENPYHIKVYDMRGSVVMENDTTLYYDSIYFMDDHEICVMNESAGQLYTRHSVKKFSYTFDQGLDYIAGQGNRRDYVFVFENTIEEVRLK